MVKDSKYLDTRDNNRYTGKHVIWTVLMYRMYETVSYRGGYCCLL